MLTKKATSKIVRLVKTGWAYKKLKKFRSEIEGCISAAEKVAQRMGLVI